MQITFLGSSHGVPEPNRKVSCALVEVGEKKYLIDAGCDPMPELINRNIHPNEINAIFITHAHGDHANGLVSFVNLCSWYYVHADPEIFLPEPELKDALRAWMKAARNNLRESIRFTQIREGAIYSDGVLKVTALRTQHIEHAYAFLLEAEGKKVLFTGDMKHADGPVADYARFVTEDGYDLVVAECAHFAADLYVEPLRRHPPKKFCFNHYSSLFLESCCRVKRQLDGEIPVLLATDGYTIRL